MIRNLRNIYTMLTRHPLTKNDTSAAFGRFVRWQIASRLLNLSVVLPFVDDTKLVVKTGMTGATGNIYVGMMEFEDMSFLLHFLTEDDLFGDIGANVGVYSVLAAGVRRARVVAIEPVPSTVLSLRSNIAVNEIGNLVTVLAAGVGAEPGNLCFSDDEDTMNHVVEEGKGVSVPVVTLDDIFREKAPSLLKIDVEGFETKVLAGAKEVLKAPDLKAIIVELNGCGARYGFEDSGVDATIRAAGFERFRYAPWTRTLHSCDLNDDGNTIYVRDMVFVTKRLSAAKSLRSIQHTI